MIGYFISGIIFLAGLIYFIYPRYEMYFKIRPKLVVEIEPTTGITKTQDFIGYSTKNKPISDGPDEMWYLYKFEWRFVLIVRNNSEVNAYEVKLLQHQSKPQIEFDNDINMQKALKSHEEIKLPFRVHKYVEFQGKDREENFRKVPDILTDLMIVFQYKNPKGNTFQSRYYFNTDKTQYEKIPKKELENYWH